MKMHLLKIITNFLDHADWIYEWTTAILMIMAVIGVAGSNIIKRRKKP